MAWDLHLNLRRLAHLLRHSASPVTGLNHFLAMLPATTLAADQINKITASEAIDLSMVLCASGIGTLIYLAWTRFRIPNYLGSSFAFILVTAAQITTFATARHVPAAATLPLVQWGFLSVFVQLWLLAWLCRFRQTANLISAILPDAIIGPAISLIGLQLSEQAAADAGFLVHEGGVNESYKVPVALITLAIIILFSVIKSRRVRKAFIVLGVAGGWAAAWLLARTWPGHEFLVHQTEVPARALRVSLPAWPAPDHLLLLFLSVIPATLVVFSEHLSRLTVVDRMRRAYEQRGAPGEEGAMDLSASMTGHALSVGASALLGSVPTTLYAENIAVLSINAADSSVHDKSAFNDRFIDHLHHPFGVAPYVFAAAFAIAVGASGFGRWVFLNMPEAVRGGMELFLYGVIAAPGIQMLVETGVNYRKITNQLLTASVLLAGISHIHFRFDDVELSGMSLGLTVGIVLNVLLKLLSRANLVVENLGMTDVLAICFRDHPERKTLVQLYAKELGVLTAPQDPIDDVKYPEITGSALLDIFNGRRVSRAFHANSGELVLSNVRRARHADVAVDGVKRLAVIMDKAGGLQVLVNAAQPLIDEWAREAADDVSDLGNGCAQIRVGGTVNSSTLREMLARALGEAPPPARAERTP